MPAPQSPPSPRAAGQLPCSSIHCRVWAIPTILLLLASAECNDVGSMARLGRPARQGCPAQVAGSWGGNGRSVRAVSLCSPSSVGPVRVSSTHGVGYDGDHNGPHGKPAAGQVGQQASHEWVRMDPYCQPSPEPPAVDILSEGCMGNLPGYKIQAHTHDYPHPLHRAGRSIGGGSECRLRVYGLTGSP